MPGRLWPGCRARGSDPVSKSDHGTTRLIGLFRLPDEVGKRAWPWYLQTRAGSSCHEGGWPVLWPPGSPRYSIDPHQEPTAHDAVAPPRLDRGPGSDHRPRHRTLASDSGDRALGQSVQQKDKEKPESKDKEKKDEPKKKAQGLPLEARPDDRVHDRRGDVGLARRLTRRQDDPLRAAGRPVHRPDRRRRREGDHRRASRSTASRATRPTAR